MLAYIGNSNCGVQGTNPFLSTSSNPAPYHDLKLEPCIVDAGYGFTRHSVRARNVSVPYVLVLVLYILHLAVATSIARGVRKGMECRLPLEAISKHVMHTATISWPSSTRPAYPKCVLPKAIPRLDVKEPPPADIV